MSTHRDELIHLQAQSRTAGRICTFFLDKEGRMDAVFYMDPKGGGRARAGYISSLLSYAEMERAKLRKEEKERTTPLFLQKPLRPSTT